MSNAEEVNAKGISAIIDYMKAHPGMTFVELEKVLTNMGINCRGNMEIPVAQNDSIVLWSGISQEAGEIFTTVLSLDEVVLKRDPLFTTMCYCIEDRMLPYPIATNVSQHYRNLR